MRSNKKVLVIVGIVIVVALCFLAFFTAKKISTPKSYVWKTVSVDYIGTFSDGTMFDTNIQDVAQKNGLYAAGRSYVPLMFTVGSGQVVAGFDKAIDGMKIGETKKITIEPKDAYGEYDKTKVTSIDKSIFDDAKVTPVSWQTYQMWGQLIKVLGVSDKKVDIDANHPMAGKTLNFEITLKAVK